MAISDSNLNQVSDNLLYFLKEKIGDTRLDFAMAPLRMKGGNETSIFKFRLKNVHASLSRPLVLRVFTKSNLPNHAIMERVVHNYFVDQGFPVPYIYYHCIALKIIFSAV